MMIAWLDEVGANDIHRVGGKGANLGEMTAAGLPVPRGWFMAANRDATGGRARR
jgi:pyruvate, water dikinase